MKNILLTSLLLVAYSAFGASQDFVGGVDFTARSNITHSALNQLVNNSTVATNKGLIIWTNGAPSVANDPKLKRYIWMDTSVNPPTIKVYDTNISSWVTSTIAAGSIGTAQLADSAVTTIKIANSAVDNSKLADDSVTSAKIVNGTIATVDYGDNTVTREKIYPGAIGPSQITNGTVTGSSLAFYSISNIHLAPGGFLIYNTNLAAGAVANSNLQPSSVQGSNIAGATIQSSNIANNAISTNLLATNIQTLLPRVFATLDSSGNILNGIGFSSASRTSAGDFTLTFASSPGITNYCAMITAGDFGGSAGDIGVNVSTNTTTAISINCWKRVDGTDVDPDLVYVLIMY